MGIGIKSLGRLESFGWKILDFQYHLFKIVYKLSKITKNKDN